MTVAAADDWDAEAGRERQDAPILFPGPESVELEPVDPVPMRAQEREDRGIVTQLTDSNEIPVGMIEYDKRLGALAEFVQQLAESAAFVDARPLRVRRERSHRRVDRRRRHSVDAEMEQRLLERYRPFERDRNVGAAAGSE